ncbi:MAG: alanine racemase [Pseudomonadota bacterium]
MPNEAVVDDRWKGIPGGTTSLRLADIGKQGWNLLRGDLPLPIALLKLSALRHNLGWMRRWAEANGVRHAPHGKTLVSPEIWRLWFEEGGAWALSVATAHQLQVARRFGVPRILMANQLVDRAGIRFLLDELARDPAFEFWALADTLAGVELLRQAAAERRIGRPLELLVEIGVAGGRAGSRSLTEALAVARAVKAAEPYLALAGIESYEGVIEGDGAARQEAAILDLLERTVAVAEACAVEKLFAREQVILSAGGSSHFDLAAERLKRAYLPQPPIVVTRSSAYLFHDHGWYEREFELTRRRRPELRGSAGPRPAIEIWAAVQSLAEPGRGLFSMGRREASFIYGMPTPILWYRTGTHDRPQPMPHGHRVTRLNDHHAFFQRPPESPLAVGDLVGLGVSLPPAVFDRWRLVFLVDDDYTVVGAVQNYS